MHSKTVDSQYLDHLLNLLNNGHIKEDRTGTGTSSIFGHQMRFNLQESFPLLQVKFTAMRPIIHELLWFLKGDTNIEYLKANNVSIWNEWADKDGNLGPVYGAQWRSWLAYDVVIDQLYEMILGLKSNPDSRRHIITAWNPADLPDESISPQNNASNGLMALAPCHTMFQFYTYEMSELDRVNWVAKNRTDLRDAQVPLAEFDKYLVPKRFLSCHLYQRSADWFLGVPFNIASYALLTHIIAKAVNMVPSEFVHSFGDTHLYSNHFDQANQLLDNVSTYPVVATVPQLVITHSRGNPWDHQLEDFQVNNYNPLPAIKAPIAV